MPKNDFTRKMILTPWQKLPKNVVDLDKLILLPKGLKSCPKSNKSPNLVTLLKSIHHLQLSIGDDGPKWVFSSIEGLYASTWLQQMDHYAIPCIFNTSRSHTYLIPRLCAIVCRVTRWLDYVFNFGHLQQWKFIQ